MHTYRTAQGYAAVRMRRNGVHAAAIYGVRSSVSWKGWIAVGCPWSLIARFWRVLCLMVGWRTCTLSSGPCVHGTMRYGRSHPVAHRLLPVHSIVKDQKPRESVIAPGEMAEGDSC